MSTSASWCGGMPESYSTLALLVLSSLAAGVVNSLAGRGALAHPVRDAVVRAPTDDHQTVVALSPGWSARPACPLCRQFRRPDGGAVLDRHLRRLLRGRHRHLDAERPRPDGCRGHPPD